MKRTITSILAIIVLTLTVMTALVSCNDATSDGGEGSTTPADTSAADTSAADTTAAGISVPVTDNPEVSLRSVTNATYTVQESTETFELAPVLAGSFRDVVKYREGEQGFKGSAGIEIQPEASIRWFAITSADWGEYTPEVLSKNYIALDAKVPDMSAYDDEYFERYALALVEVCTQYCDFHYDVSSGSATGYDGESIPFIHLTQTYPTDESVPRPEMYGRYFFVVGLYKSYDGQNLKVSYTKTRREGVPTADRSVKYADPLVTGSFKEAIDYQKQNSENGKIRFFVVDSGDWGDYTFRDFRADDRTALERLSGLSNGFFEDKAILLVDIRSASMANQYEVSFREEGGMARVDISQTYPTGNPNDAVDWTVGNDLYAFDISRECLRYSIAYTVSTPNPDYSYATTVSAVGSAGDLSDGLGDVFYAFYAKKYAAAVITSAEGADRFKDRYGFDLTAYDSSFFEDHYILLTMVTCPFDSSYSVELGGHVGDNIWVLINNGAPEEVKPEGTTTTDTPGLITSFFEMPGKYSNEGVLFEKTHP